MEAKSKNRIAVGIIAVCAVALAVQWWPKREPSAERVAERSPYDEPPAELTAGFDGALPEVAPDGLASASSGAPASESRATALGEPALGEPALGEIGAPAASVEGPIASGSGVAVDAGFDALLAKLESLHPRTPEDGALAALGAAWSSDAKHDSALPDEHPLDAELVDDTVATFVAAHPLTGVIHSERLSSALFGGYVVRAGEPLPGLAARVEAIDSRGVTVSSRGRTVVVPMPPFVPRAPASAEHEPEPADPAAGSPNAGPAAGGPVPASNPAPVPAPAKQETVPDVPHQG
ncbi:MAG: hypothetical protein IT453_05840 [Planctomycetes bacterium]|nr:hypothetical protein [Planctomycetota bacterium]